MDERELRSHVSEGVRQGVEETLNGLLEVEAEALCQARRYERNAQRTRAGHSEHSTALLDAVILYYDSSINHPFGNALVQFSVIPAQAGIQSAPVIPAQAGIQYQYGYDPFGFLGPRLRGGDDSGK